MHQELPRNYTLRASREYPEKRDYAERTPHSPAVRSNVNTMISQT